MFSSTLRTYESCEISDRLTRPAGWAVGSLLSLMLGTMLYPAIRLIPSESLHCSSAPDFLPNEELPVPLYTYYSNISSKSILLPVPTRISTSQPLLLWGLTHGIVTDFLEFLPSYNRRRWAWPTFSHLDLRFLLWLMTYRFRLQRLHRFSVDQRSPLSIIEEGFATRIEKTELRHESTPSLLRDRLYTVTTSQILDGYYDRVRKAVIIILVLRIGFGSAILFGLLKRLRRRASHPQ